MRINRKAGFEFTNVLLLVNEILMGQDDSILFAIDSDRNRVASGQRGDLIPLTDELKCSDS